MIVAPCGSPAIGSTRRYAKFARTYRVVTIIVPKKSASGRLRPGRFTSEAVKVMSYQASEAKSDPTIATPTTVTVEISHVLTPGGYACCTESPALYQKLWKFAATASARANRNPTITNAAKETVFTLVKTFWTILPRRRPRKLIHVSSTMEMIASKFCRLRPRSYGPSIPNGSFHGPKVPNFSIQAVGENHGAKTPVNFAKAMATAAIVAVCTTSSIVQP